MKKLLISGGNGKFAQQIIKFNENQFEIWAPSKEEMDIRNKAKIEQYILKIKPDIFLHAAAITRPMVKHVKNPDLSIETNIVGTANVVLMCMKYNIKLVYISTDYVYPGTKGNYSENDALLPVNKYAWSKMGGECAVMLYKNSLILRMCMSDKPFPHPKALIDIKKSLIYNEEAARITLQLLDQFGIINVGGKARSVYDFAHENNPNIGKISLKEINDVNMAKDSTMNIQKMKKILKKKGYRSSF